MSITSYLLNGNEANNSAKEVGGGFQLMASEGVLNTSGTNQDFEVTESAVPAMTVAVADGAVHVQYTKDAETWKVINISDAVATLNITANTSGSNRIDAVIIHMLQDAPDNLKDNVGELVVIPGSGITALLDADIDNAIGDANWYRLADVTVANGAVTILDASITDTRAGIALEGMVDTTNDQTVGGVKTFSSFPVTPSTAPTTNYQAANKKYVDDNVGSAPVQVTYTAEEAMDIGKPVSASSIAGQALNMVKNSLNNPGTVGTVSANNCGFTDACNIDDNVAAVIYTNNTDNKVYLAGVSVDPYKEPTMGTPVEVQSVTANLLRICKVGTNKVAVIYLRNANATLYSRIATFVGTVPTLGAELIVSAIGGMDTAYHYAADITAIGTDRIVVAWRDNNLADAGSIVASTLTGTTIDAYSVVQTFEAGTVKYVSLSKNSATAGVVFYQDGGDSNHGKGHAFSIAGTVITLNGTPVDFETNGTCQYIDSSYIEDNNILLTWNYLTDVFGAIASLSGLTISYGAVTTIYDSASTPAKTVNVVIDTTHAFLVTEDGGTNSGHLFDLTLDTAANTVTNDDRLIYNTLNSGGNIEYPSIAKLGDRSQFIAFFQDEDDTNKLKCEAYQVYDNSDSLIGFASSTVVATDPIAVRSKGEMDNQTVTLTPGLSVYVQGGGEMGHAETDIRVGVANATDTIDLDIDRKFLNLGVGDGSDGPLVIASGTTYLNLGQVYNFSSISLSGGATLAFTGDEDAALVNCLGNCTLAGTVELRNSVTDRLGIITQRFNLTTGDGFSFTASEGGVGGVGAFGGGAGGDGDAASGSPGTGGAGGALSTIGADGEGGNSTVGGGGGGGGGGNLGVGSAGSTTANDNGGNGGTPGSGNDGPGGGGAGGAINSGNGGTGAAGASTGSGNGSGGQGGAGGNSGPDGGNGGLGGTGGNSSVNAPSIAGGLAGKGGDGYAAGGVGGIGGVGNPAATGGVGGRATHGTGGTGGAGAIGGAGHAGGQGGAGGDGRTGGVGGIGGLAASHIGGQGGTGGNGLTGATAFLLQVGGDLNVTGVTVNAQGGAGGAGGNGPAANGAAGDGGDGGRGSDVIMVCVGTLTGGTGGVYNSGGASGAPGLATGTGAVGEQGAQGEDGKIYVNKLTNM